jgi:hypothetical protein
LMNDTIKELSDKITELSGRIWLKALNLGQ